MTLALFTDDIECNGSVGNVGNSTEINHSLISTSSSSVIDKTPYGFSSQDWLNELALWHLVNHSIVTWRGLITHFGSAECAIQSSVADWKSLKLHASHIKRFNDWLAHGKEYLRFEQTLQAIQHGEFHLLYEQMPEYPSSGICS